MTAVDKKIADLDTQKAEKFAEKMVGVLNSGAVALMISVGHRTELFDVMSALAPSTSEEIAKVSGLNERYVREWLGAMVVSGIIDYDPDRRTYSLPPEHALLLTRASNESISGTMQFVPVLGSVEDQIIECFRKGGGVPYSAYPRFHEVMADESEKTIVVALIDHILPLVPGLIESLKSGIDVLDVGCGRGRALNLLARTYPASRFTGYDFSDEAVSDGRAEAAGLNNLRLEVRDVASLEEVERYHLITAFDSIHDQAKPARVLEGIARALRSDGVFLAQDITGSSHLEKNYDLPVAPFLYSISCLHCMTVSLALDGAGLGTMWGEEKATEMMKEAGFSRIEVKRLPHDIMNNYYIAGK